MNLHLTNSEAPPNTAAIDTTGDSAKLLSLLALATGAVAMPQTSNADIIFVDLSANPVHIGQLASHDFVINTLPGTAQIGFHAHTLPTAITSSRWVTVRQQAGYVRFVTKPLFGGYIMMRATAGQTWNQIRNQAGVFASKSGTAGFANYYGGYPGSFGGKYYLFEFRDSTQGNALRFGWISVSLANPPSGNLDLAIDGYAYDTTGIRLGAGQVPEPSAPALVALGAMVFGAKGLRSWRKNRKTDSKV